MPRHQNSVVRSIIEQVFCFNLRKTHQDFDFFSSSKSLYVSLIFPYFIRALPARNKEKDPPDCLIHILQIIENWTNFVATLQKQNNNKSTKLTEILIIIEYKKIIIITKKNHSVLTENVNTIQTVQAFQE